jgi:hypothetical protein
MVGWVRRERSQTAKEPAISIARPAAGTARVPTFADRGAPSCCRRFFDWSDTTFS